jgi:hypothetical protein
VALLVDDVVAVAVDGEYGQRLSDREAQEVAELPDGPARVGEFAAPGVAQADPRRLAEAGLGRDDTQARCPDLESNPRLPV